MLAWFTAALVAGSTGLQGMPPPASLGVAQGAPTRPVVQAPAVRSAEAKVPVGPDLPAGTNAAFQRVAIGVQEHLQRGEWAAAERLSRRLPRRELTLTWDDRAVPVDLRAAYAQARDRAMEAWVDRYRDLKIRIAPQGMLRVGFAPQLPPGPDSVGPAGAAFVFSEAPTDPRVDAVIALRRGAQRSPATPRDVRNEVAYAIGAALGLERTPRSGGVMDRHDFSYTLDTAILAYYLRIAREVQEISDTLRQAVVQRTRLTPPRPQARLDVVELRPADAVQGDRVRMAIGLTNVGNGTLRFEVLPDCGCFSVATARELGPGETTTIQIQADTTEFPGPFDKAIYVTSNDLDRSMRRVPVKFYVEPRYRFLSTDTASVRLVPDEGLRTDVFLAVSPRKPFQVKRVETSGVTAMVEVTPWKGTLPDPDLKEGPKARQGYRLRILTTPNMPMGRLPMTLNVETDDPSLGVIRETLTLQRGIVALPGSLFLGELGKAPVRAWVLLNRPGQWFRVTAASTDHPNLTTRVEPIPGRPEVRVVVLYDGKADAGDMSAILTVKTDDPRQSEIRVPIRGTVR